MNGTRIGRAVAAAAIGATMAAGSVAAASTDVTVTHGIVLDTPSFASRTCGFPIELHTVGKEVSIKQYDADGELRQELTVQQYNGYLLNPANGKTIMSKVAGAGRLVYHEDGSITESGSGSTVRTAPGAGLVSGFIGHTRVTLVPTGEVDEEGFPVYDFVDETSAGQFLGNGGVCDILR
jgi:hypothetical protein